MSLLQYDDPTKNWALTANNITPIYNQGIIFDVSGNIAAANLTARINGNVKHTLTDASFTILNNLVVNGNASVQALSCTNQTNNTYLTTGNINATLANPTRTDVSYNFSVVNLTDTSNNLLTYYPNSYQGKIGFTTSTNILYAYKNSNWISPGTKMSISVSGNSSSGSYSSGGYTYSYAVWTASAPAGGTFNVTYPPTNSSGNTFTSAITINSLSNNPVLNTIDFLIVAGGGGGGAGLQGGGGGAGGLISSTSAIGATGGGNGTNIGPFIASSLTSYNVTVGAGGLGGKFIASPSTGNQPPAPGGNSSISFCPLVVVGGGSGAGEQNSGNPLTQNYAATFESRYWPQPFYFSTQTPVYPFTGSYGGLSGGTGGGGAHGGPGLNAAGGGMVYQGYSGGAGYSGLYPGNNSYYIGGGGGGAGGSGADANGTTQIAGSGGIGLVNTITGTAVGYAGGGGGSSRSGTSSLTYGGNGGTANGSTIGGNSSYSSNNPTSGYGTNGAANTGSGGGASSGNTPSTSTPSGGNGANGIVIIRWITGP
jgi:hypothetical protein